MKAIVKTQFRDKYSKEIYEIGDEIEVTQERIEEIFCNLGENFIEVSGTKSNEGDEKLIDEVTFPKFIKNGVYELSNGDQIKANKNEAAKAEAALNEK